MATIIPIAASQTLAVRTIVWENLQEGDDGAPAEVRLHQNWTIQAVGTFGSQGKVLIEGSNDGVIFVPLKQASQNTEIELTNNEIQGALLFPLFVRPRITGGSAATDLTVTLIGRRS